MLISLPCITGFMTAQPLFDTARFRDRPTTPGMPDGQARALTEGLDEALRDATATRADVNKQDDRLTPQMAEQKARLGVQVLRLDTKFEAVEKHLDECFGCRLAESQATQLKWFVASLFGGFGLLFAALKLFP